MTIQVSSPITPSVGKWYFISYGSETPIAYCKSIGNGIAVMSFRWGGPYRTLHPVEFARIIAESPDPRWIKRPVLLLASIVVCMGAIAWVL